MGRPKKTNQNQPDLISATKTGDRLETLIALRDLLADRLQNTTSSRDISAISRRLMQCISEIEILTAQKQSKENSTFNLAEFRKQLNVDKMGVNKQYKLNSITSEHENF